MSAFINNTPIVAAFVRAAGSVGWMILLMLLVMYIYSVLGVTLYRDAFPWAFGSLGAAMFTLFQIMTLDGWAGSCDPRRCSRGSYGMLFVVTGLGREAQHGFGFSRSELVSWTHRSRVCRWKRSNRDHAVKVKAETGHVQRNAVARGLGARGRDEDDGDDVDEHRRQSRLVTRA